MKSRIQCRDGAGGFYTLGRVDGSQHHSRRAPPYSPTFTNCFPIFFPSSILINARGAFSSPSTTSLRAGISPLPVRFQSEGLPDAAGSPDDSDACSSAAAGMLAS